MNKYAVALVALLTTGAPLWAQTAPAAGASQAAPAPRQLGAWWIVNARAVTPLPEEWLVHSEGQISISKSTGNVEGHSVAGGALLAIRKRLVTNLTSLSTNVNEISLGAGRGHVKQEVFNVTDLLLFNVVNRTNLAGGGFIERDDPKFVKRRVAAFGGVNQFLVTRPKDTLQAFAGLGWETDRFTVPGFDVESAILYVSEAYNAQFAPRVFVRQALELVFDLEESSRSRRNFSGSIDFQVAKFLTISPTFQIRHDGHTTPFAQKTDTMTMVAVRFTR